MIQEKEILQKYWGYTSFKPKQEEIINSVLNGRDTIALLPTGGGKSLCFQIPAMINDGICIVISPLVALMEDQVNNLTNRGIKALKISGGISFEDLNRLLENAMYGNYKFLYLSPERLQQELVQNSIRLMNVNLIAIDEAHCISQWGNDFRPAYKNITILRDLQPLAPFIALTATATPEVLKDTISELKLEEPVIFKNSFVRKNLSYQVFKEDDKLYRVERLLKNNPDSAIIYVRSRSLAAETSSHLNKLGISATFYHGGISNKDKNNRLKDWLNGSISTIVATNAFGMGIDNPNVRYVIHIQIPESPESYFQEAGRAGRDGKYAEAILLYSEYDKLLVKNQFIESLPNPKFLKKLYRTLNNYFQISYGEGEFTEHNFNFTTFCKTYNLNYSLAFNGLNSLDRLGIIQLSLEFGRKSSLQFIVPSNRLLQYFENNSLLSIIGKTILRMYGGIFETPATINLDLIASKTGQPINSIIEALKKMETDQMVELTLRTTDSGITFLVPREDDKTINVVSREVLELNEKKVKQVQAVVRYIENDTECRSVQLVSYFGEETKIPCGICSYCKKSSSKLTKDEIRAIAQKIKTLLIAAPMTSREISEKLTFTESKIIQTLNLLLDAGKIKINSRNQFFIP